ncbi:MAG: fluoride efflux transporter FluC [Bacilli bacterium]
MTGILIGVGAAMGAVSRYVVYEYMKKRQGGNYIATLFVNIVGSFLFGMCSALVRDVEMLAFLTTGILGGFTTFSTFSMDTSSLRKKGNRWMFYCYIFINVFGSIATCYLGVSCFS